MTGLFRRGALLAACLAATLSPAAPRADHTARYRALEKAGRFEEAIPLLETAIREYPKEARYRVYLGHSYKKLGRFAESIPPYEAALALRPDDQRVRTNVAAGLLGYGHFLAKSGDDAAALPYYEKSVSVWPNVWYLYQYARLLARLKLHVQIPAAVAAAAKGYEQSDRGNREARYAEFFGWATGELMRVGRRDLAEEVVATVYRAEAPEAIRETAARFFIVTGAPDRAQQIILTLSGPRSELLSGEAALAREDWTAAERILSAAVARDVADYDLPGRIARAFADRARMHPDDRKSEPFRLAWRFETLAVERYFARKPFVQSQTFSAPLTRTFVAGRGHGHWGKYRSHYAIDLKHLTGAQMGTPVVAAADGVVIDVTDRYPDQAPGVKYSLVPANVVRIRHDDALISEYVHLQQGSALVRKGEHVTRGQRVASMGNSGYSGGPHLHFAVRTPGGMSVPIKYLGISCRKRNCAACVQAPTTGFYESGFAYEPR